MSKPFIAISARFSSGSTALWNLFRSFPEYRAYYEPCHDNLLSHIRHTLPKAGHEGVEDYWGAYRSLEQLDQVHRPGFGLCRLWLEATDDHPELETYIRHLVEHAGERTAVLQFNRLDFRLGWLKARFPAAKIIHLYRRPRDNWFSMVRHLPEEQRDDPCSMNMYDLPLWALSLSDQFPFLVDEAATDSYSLHYAIWKMSWLCGQRQADLSLAFDADLIDNTPAALSRIAELEPGYRRRIEAAAALIKRQEEGLWRSAHSVDYFEEREERIDRLFRRLGLEQHLGLLPLAEIRREFDWKARNAIPEAFRYGYLEQFSQFRDEQIRLLAQARRLESALWVEKQRVAPAQNETIWSWSGTS